MKTLKLGYLFLLCATAILWAACASETKVKGENQLLGTWQVVEATRSGKTTETLVDAFMRFDPSGKMVTNLTGTEQTTDFSLEKDNIVAPLGGQERVPMQIVAFDGETMSLKFQLLSHDFVLNLERKME